MAPKLRPWYSLGNGLAPPTTRAFQSPTKRCKIQGSRRPLSTAPYPGTSGKALPAFAFAFDIDGVLLRSSAPLPGAGKALTLLQHERIPFILLTNGGGKSEQERVSELQSKLNVKLDESLIVQSHTPFADLRHLHDKTVLVVGGDGATCKRVAQGYGFKDVVTPADLIVAEERLWPFGEGWRDYYRTFAEPLSKPPYSPTGNPDLKNSLKLDAIFVYNDPRDWGLDASIILDALLSKDGVLGTLSPKNGKEGLRNRGYLQDGQPPLYFSNPDLWWATSYHLSRLGQGGFALAFEGLWRTVTNGAELAKTVIGKPSQQTYEYAENCLRRHRKARFGHIGLNDPLKRVYMIGDNPESDIAGANGYVSPHGSHWKSILVKTGVYRDGEVPAHKPDVITDNVLEAVEWAMKDARECEI